MTKIEMETRKRNQIVDKFIALSGILNTISGISNDLKKVEYLLEYSLLNEENKREILNSYYQRLRSGKAQSLYPETQVYEAVLDFVGYPGRFGSTDKEFMFREKTGKGVFKNVFLNHLVLLTDFISFFLKYEFSIRYTERNIVPFLSILNILSGEPIGDTSLIDAHRNHYRDNLTLKQSPLFGGNPFCALPETSAQKTIIPFTQKNKIKILLPGISERFSGKRTTEYFKDLIRLIPDGLYDEIELVGNDVLFFCHEILFDENRKLLRKKRLIQFDDRNEYMINDQNANFKTKIPIRYIQLDPSDPTQDISNPSFEPDELYDIIFSSRLELCFSSKGKEIREQVKNNHFKLLNEGGIILYDSSHQDHIEFYHKGDNSIYQIPTVIPYLDYYKGLDDQSYVPTEQSYGRIGSSRLITSAFEIASRYQTIDNPLLDRKIIAHLLSQLESPYISDEFIAAILLKGVPQKAIRKYGLFKGCPKIQYYNELIKIDPDLRNQFLEFVIFHYKQYEIVKVPLLLRKLGNIKLTEDKCMFDGELFQIFSVDIQDITFITLKLDGNFFYFKPKPSYFKQNIGPDL